MIKYEYEQFIKDIRYIADMVNVFSTEVSGPQYKWAPDVIVGIARGGLVPATYLSHMCSVPLKVITWQSRDGSIKESLPLWYANDRRILLVDDINDSGLTFKQILDDTYSKNDVDNSSFRKNVKTASMWERKTSVFTVDWCPNKIDNDEWIEFPWEERRTNVTS